MEADSPQEVKSSSPGRWTYTGACAVPQEARVCRAQDPSLDARVPGCKASDIYAWLPPHTLALHVPLVFQTQVPEEFRRFPIPRLGPLSRPASVSISRGGLGRLLGIASFSCHSPCRPGLLSASPCLGKVPIVCQLPGLPFLPDLNPSRKH